MPERNKRGRSRSGSLEREEQQNRWRRIALGTDEAYSEGEESFLDEPNEVVIQPNDGVDDLLLEGDSNLSLEQQILLSKLFLPDGEPDDDSWDEYDKAVESEKVDAIDPKVVESHRLALVRSRTP